MNEKQFKTSRAAQKADDAWSKELLRLFGSDAGDVRYTKRAEGAEGTELRRLWDARVAACAAWGRDLNAKDRERCEPTGNAERIDLPALRAALETLQAHQDLITAAIDDLSFRPETPDISHCEVVCCALDHILTDEFRSDETRGGS